MQHITARDVVSANREAITNGKGLILFDPVIDFSNLRVAYFDKNTGCKCAIGVAMNQETLDFLSAQPEGYQDVILPRIISLGIVSVPREDFRILLLLQRRHDSFCTSLKLARRLNPELFAEKLIEARNEYGQILNAMLSAANSPVP